MGSLSQGCHRRDPLLYWCCQLWKLLISLCMNYTRYLCWYRRSSSLMLFISVRAIQHDTFNLPSDIHLRKKWVNFTSEAATLLEQTSSSCEFSSACKSPFISEGSSTKVCLVNGLQRKLTCGIIRAFFGIHVSHVNINQWSSQINERELFI